MKKTIREQVLQGLKHERLAHRATPATSIL